MNEQTRAAADRIAAYLARRRPELHDRIAYSDATRNPAVLFASDLRTVLAALDEQPAAILVNDAIMSDTEYEETKQRFLAQARDWASIRPIGDTPKPPITRCARCHEPIIYDRYQGIWLHLEMPVNCSREAIPPADATHETSDHCDPKDTP